MSDLSGNVSGTPEQWELQENRFKTRLSGELSLQRRLAAFLSVGLVTGVKISNLLSIHVLLPDMWLGRWRLRDPSTSRHLHHIW